MSHDISFIFHIMVTFLYYHDISLLRIKRWWISSWYIKISNPYTLIQMPANIWDYGIYIPVSHPGNIWHLYDIDINILILSRYCDMIMIQYIKISSPSSDIQRFWHLRFWYWYYHDMIVILSWSIKLSNRLSDKICLIVNFKPGIT